MMRHIFADSVMCRLTPRAGTVVERLGSSIRKILKILKITQTLKTTLELRGRWIHFTAGKDAMIQRHDRAYQRVKSGAVSGAKFSLPHTSSVFVSLLLLTGQ